MLGERLGSGREAELYEWSPGVALRLLHDAPDADVRREREELALLVAAAAGAPVPAMFGRHDIDGRRGLLVERICGADMLTDVRRRPWSLSTAGATLGRLHAEIHTVEAPEELPSLHEKIERGLTTTDVVPADLKRELFGRLDELERGSALLHGDFQPTNVLLGDRPLVIDWGSATRGPAAADVARTLVTLRVGAPPPGAPHTTRMLDRLGRRLLIATYVRSYARNGQLDLDEVRRWYPLRAADRLLAAIPEERAHLSALIRSAR